MLTVWLAFGAWPSDQPEPRAAAARLNDLGVAFMNQQRMDKAVESFDQAAKADPTLATAYLNKGIALLNLQKTEEARVALEQAAAKDPKNPRVWYNLGLLCRTEGKNEEAIRNFQKVLELDPSDPDAHYFIGTLYAQDQQYEKAIADFQTALRLNRLHASAEFGLARALQRSGKSDEARDHLRTFEHLTKTKISSPLTLAYGEQGRYSTAQDVITTHSMAGPMIPITLTAQPVAANPASAQATAGGKPADPRAEGGGMCLLDLDGDGLVDLVAMGAGADGVMLYRNLGNGSWKELAAKTAGLAGSGNALACAVGDFDNDGLNDLAIVFDDHVALFRNLGNGKFADVTKQVGIGAASHPVAATFVDFDHDGDLDLFVTGKALGDGGSPNALWRNNGNQTFTNWTAESGMGGTGASVTAVLSDINNDRAVDLVTTGSAAAPAVFTNPREGQFLASPLYEATGLPPTEGIYVFDFNKDGWMDVAVTHAGAPGISLWRNVDGRHLERVPLPVEAQRGWGVTAVDIDNDGWLDLAVIVETASGSELRVLRNRGSTGFEDVSAALGLAGVKLRNPRSLLAADVDGDGDNDLVVSQLDDSPVVLRNDGGNRNRSLRIELKGLADNKTALGTKVEVFANGLWQKWEVPGASGYLGQGPQEILAGLGSNDHVDIVRMLWPTGVLQDEIDLALNKPASFTELDRRGSSCPTLFAWNGGKYEFVADVIGAGVVGHWISPTAKNTPDPDEWIKIDGSQLRPRQGYLSVRFGEPMEEVNFVDQFRLLAVDHPVGTEVYPNERFLNEPPFASGEPVLTSAPHPPLAAVDDLGRDVLPLLRERDHRYVRDFTNLQYAGFANLHRLTLDLGPWTAEHPLRLFLHGFIEYFSATSMYSAWQAGLKPISPYIEAELADGRWQRVVDEMGFPAGLPRTITVDLSGKLPVGTRRIRLVTNLQIYWDQVLVDNGPGRDEQVRISELPLSQATLAFRGYPRQIDGKTPGDLTYEYESASATGPFARERGNYTHYGDVTPLLNAIDDRFVIFGSGEDIDAEFGISGLPPVPAGWRRDYFFYANGYVKDMDFYEAAPFTVADMPFHGMKSYPYPATQHYPEDRYATSYRLDWNDRFESGDATASGYRFRYLPRAMDPEPLIPPSSDSRRQRPGVPGANP